MYNNYDHVLIECKNLTKEYGNKCVFNDASFTISTGITGLVAPNGYGKTTFIEMCAGVRKNYTGTINIFGKIPDQVKQFIGFVADKPAFPKNLKVGEYINIVSEIYGTQPDMELIQLAKMDSVYNLRIKDLSAGYLKRLAFITAVAHHPKLVLADEPFSNVDKPAVDIMQEMIIKLGRSGISFIISSHDLNELVNVADRILIIGEHRFKEIKTENIESKALEISSEDDEMLYNLLRNSYEVKKTDSGLVVFYTELKPLLETLIKFDKEIFKLKIVDRRGRFLDEVYKAISKD